MKKQQINQILHEQMADYLQVAVVEKSNGEVSEHAYDSVVDTFYQMRDCWEAACDDMEMAALHIRNQLKVSIDHLALTASVIVNHAEEQVKGVTVECESPAMLPFDYKGLTILIQFFNVLTCGQLAQRYQVAMA